MHEIPPQTARKPLSNHPQTSAPSHRSHAMSSCRLAAGGSSVLGDRCAWGFSTEGMSLPAVIHHQVHLRPQDEAASPPQTSLKPVANRHRSGRMAIQTAHQDATYLSARPPITVRNSEFRAISRIPTAAYCTYTEHITTYVNCRFAVATGRFHCTCDDSTACLSAFSVAYGRRLTMAGGPQSPVSLGKGKSDDD